jgi:integrase
VKGSVVKRCGCTAVDPETGKRRQLGKACPELAKSGHGTWAYVADLGPDPRTGMRRQAKKGGFPRKRDAEEALAKIVPQVNQRMYVRPVKVTVDEHLASWLESKRLAGKRPSTMRSYEDALRPIREEYGRKALQDLTPEDVEAVKAGMLDGSARRVGTPGKPLSARSVNYMIGRLREALDQAVRRGKVARNVAALVDRVEGDARPSAAWTPEQVQRFKGVAAKDRRLYAAWLLTMYGLRRGEVLGLRWGRGDGDSPRHSWVDLDERTLTISGPEATRTIVAGRIVFGPPKTKRGERTVPLDDVLMAALRSLRTRQARERLEAGPAYEDDGYGLVVVDELGRGVSPAWYSDEFKRLARQARVPVVRLHDARHTSVTIMRSLGIADHIVAKWHGHDETVMRNTYTKTYMDDLRAAAQQRAISGA